MRTTLYLIAAAMALATGPAAAQENVAEPTVNAANETMTTDTNVAMDANLVAATPAANAVEPVPAPTETDLATGRPPTKMTAAAFLGGCSAWSA